MVQGVFAMLNKTGTYKGIDDMNIMQRFAYFMYFFWGGEHEICIHVFSFGFYHKFGSFI